MDATYLVIIIKEKETERDIGEQRTQLETANGVRMSACDVQIAVGTCVQKSVWRVTEERGSFCAEPRSPCPTTRSLVAAAAAPQGLRKPLLDLSMSFSIIPGIWCSVNAWSDVDCSLLLGDDLNLLSDGKALLLPVDHDLEALEVGELRTFLSLGELLGDGHGGPLFGESGLSGGLLEGSSAATTLNGDLQLGQGQSLQWHNHSGEVLTVDEDAVLVSDIDDSDHLTVVISEVNESNSAGFHEVFVSLNEQN